MKLNLSLYCLEQISRLGLKNPLFHLYFVSKVGTVVYVTVSRFIVILEKLKVGTYQTINCSL